MKMSVKLNGAPVYSGVSVYVLLSALSLSTYYIPFLDKGKDQ